MKSRATKQFWKLYQALPAEIQATATRAYAQWLENPHYPGLHFKRVDPEDSIYSIRITRKYRALGILRGETMVRFWIGKHDTYNRLLR